ncbi:uncharacterized protein LOC116431457 [Nomia melanderi]|uniref:uncharacterized protein LOC116431457 n=1 Tax=Nomia melanderi TaxID=2448451 RepID=UPI0013045BA8|nr:cell division cycle-associated protein 7-like [Nomia melanderi]XP_031842776.1 cell division cycle-associated protein 7-like [Nomia melanderi]
MDKNDYDDLRRRNIAEKNAALAEFFKDIKAQANEVKELEAKFRSRENLENEPPRKRRRTVSSAGDDDDAQGKRVRLKFRKTYNTRSRSRSGCNEELNGVRRSKRKLQVLFPWAKPFERSLDLMKMGVCDVDQEEQYESSSDNEDENENENDYDDDDDADFDAMRRGKISKAPYDPATIPSVDEITESMLNNIADRSMNKQYCKVNGTSCHQCRQKTMDTKTVCRSGECIGVRGQFCGPCLRGRYGESALEALKDPNWACPPCRGLCNCSICRTRSGLRPTGILATIVQKEGYTSVLDYLQTTEIHKS